MPLFHNLGQGGPLGAIGNQRAARLKALSLGTRPDLALIAKYAPAPAMLHDFARTDLTFQDVNGIAAADDVTEAVALAVSMDSIGDKTLAAARAQGVKDDFSYANTAALQAVWSAQAGVTASLDNGRILIATDTDGGYVVRAFTLAAGTWLFGIDLQGGTGSCDCVLATTSTGSDVLSSLGGSTGAGSGIVRRGGVFTWTGGTLYCRVRTGPDGGAGATNWAGNITFVPGNHAIQSGSTGARLTRNANGAACDGVDDNLLTGLTFGAVTDQFHAFDIYVPATLSTAQYVMGTTSNVANTDNTFNIGVNATGNLVGNVGNQLSATIVDQLARDFRGQRLQGALVLRSGVVDLVLADGSCYSGAFSGNRPAATSAYRLGSRNSSAGVAVGFFGGTIRRTMSGNFGPTVAELQSVLSHWSTQ